MVRVNFAESVTYLYSLGNEVSAMKLGLGNIRTLIAALGKAQNSFLKVQVAGTNGKGSVCAFLDEICLSADIKTGLYTSPHLISITERIRIKGFDISESEFARHATLVREMAESLLAKGELKSRPTFFEQMTAIALVAFAEAKIELAILETGLGGRLDATTAANAAIAAITPIDYDHQEYLGETLAEIAAEKAAIIHEGSTVVVGNQKSEAMTMIWERCSALGVDLTLTESVTAVQKGGNTSGSECVTSAGESQLGTEAAPSLPVGFPPSFRVDFISPQATYENVSLGLSGRYQIGNAKVAILLAETLQDHFPITNENIVEGLQNARHPGRLEFSGKYLFDGAHNAAGAKALGEYIDEFVDQPLTVVFGAMKDKDIAGIGEILFPKADRLILTQSENSRAMSAREILMLIPERIDHERILLAENVEQALAKAVKISRENGLILVTGSLYLVGEAKKILKDNLKYQI